MMDKFTTIVKDSLSMESYNHTVKALSVMMLLLIAIFPFNYTVLTIGDIEIAQLACVFVFPVISIFLLRKVLQIHAYYWLPVIGLITCMFLENYDIPNEFSFLYLLAIQTISIVMLIVPYIKNLKERVGVTNVLFGVLGGILLASVLLYILVNSYNSASSKTHQLVVYWERLAVCTVMFPIMSSWRSLLTLPAYLMFCLAALNLASTSVLNIITPLAIAIVLMFIPKAYRMMKTKLG